MNKPTNIALTIPILNNIIPNEIIYAEITEEGAMGNDGGIMLYLLEKEKLICYETNIYDNEEIYIKARALIEKPEYKFEFNANLFEYYYGGMGNHIFVNKNVILEIEDGYFIYKNKNIEYQILPSVRGVFNSVMNAMQNPETD